MKYMKVVNGVVVQIQPNEEAGFVEAPNNAICGMLFDGLKCTIPPAIVTQTSKRAEVDSHCSGMFTAGFVYVGNTYQINGDAQDNIGKRATYAGWSKADPVTFPWVEPYSLGWWDITNTWHPMTVDEFMLFAKAVSDYVSSCAACCRYHKSAITTENCETYDYTTGWPVNP